MAGQPWQDPRGWLPSPGMAKGRARAPLEFCSSSYYFVLLCQGLALAKSTNSGRSRGVILANPQDLASPGCNAAKLQTKSCDAHRQGSHQVST